MTKNRLFTIIVLLVLLSSLSVPNKIIYAASTSVNVLATNASGTPTGINVTKGQPLTFQASGTWCSGGIKNDGSPSCGGPEGIRPANPGETVDLVLPNQLIGMLIGRIGTWVFPIGSSAQISAQASGQLYLLMNDRTCCYADNSGQVNATISIGGGGVPRPLILHKETGIGELSNLTFVSVDVNLTTTGLNEATVKSIVVTTEVDQPACGLSDIIGVQIYSKGRLVWEKLTGNRLLVVLPIPFVGYNKTVVPDRPIVVSRGESYILVNFTTIAAHFNNANICDFSPPTAEGATGSLQLNVLN